MKYCSPFCAGIWPFLLVPLLLLPVVLAMKWHSIEEKIAQNALAAIAEKHVWAEVESFNRGGDVLLTGIALSEEDVADALRLASAAPGVRTMEFSGRIIPPTPTDSELSLSFYEDRIEVEGSLSNDTQVQDILAATKKKFPDAKVVARLETGNRIEPTSQWSKLIAVADHLGTGGSLSILGEALTVKGEVKSTQDRELLETQFRSVFPGTVDNQIAVVPPKISCEGIINEALSETKINFAIARARIKPESDDLIAKLASATKRCPFKNFEVSGHTDNTGSLQVNMDLSERRAQALIDRLVSLGLERSRFEAKGFGPNKPVADNKSSDGRAANRRIEFRATN